MEEAVSKKKLSIDERFQAFHQRNPAIYELVKQQAKRALRAHKKKFGVKQIIEWIRWEYFIKTTDNSPQTKIVGSDQKQSFKIDNNYTSRYARKLVEDYPEFKQFIELRELRS